MKEVIVADCEYVYVLVVSILLGGMKPILLLEILALPELIVSTMSPGSNS